LNKNFIENYGFVKIQVKYIVNSVNKRSKMFGVFGFFIVKYKMKRNIDLKEILYGFLK